MANRDENLKKINDTLEQLSDEELDKVAGGGYNPEEVIKKFGDVLKNMGKPIGEMIELFTGGKTSKS